MTPERWQQIEQIFYLAQEREPSQRDVFLSEACGGEVALRREVESLLAAYDQPDCYLETLQAEVAAQFLEDKGETMVGRMLGRYQILAPLGAGGMGEVYRALDTRLDREVAVKILPPHLATSPEALLRFEREAKAVAALSHPNILAIHDFGAEQGVNYAVMELLNGETLRGRLAGGALPWRKAVTIGMELAEGLSVAHAKGITHRDLKPENIFLTSDGRTKILDFGLARIKPAVKPEEHSSAPTAPLVTDPGIVLGTLGYMSPEQVRGEHADAPSDIFSFGCVLFEMVTGQQAFKRKTATESLAAILRDEPPALADARKLIPQELEVVMTHCLEKNPTERFQSASDIAFALRTIASTSGGTRRFTKPAHLARHGVVLIAGVLLLFGVVLILLVGTWKNPWSGIWPFANWSSGSEMKSHSLVVLPFDNVSANSGSEYISDGITENIINSLAQLPQLQVTPRTNSVLYRGQAKNAQKIGHELGVKFVVTGTVGLHGDRLIVQFDLIDVLSGTQKWGDRFNLKSDDLIIVQEKIAHRISEILKLKLTDAQEQSLTKRPTLDTEANKLYMKGRHNWDKRTPEGISASIDFFQQAIAKDPNYALAYAGLADAYIMQGDGSQSLKERMLNAREAATQALKLDNTIAEAHTSLAAISHLYDWDWVTAESEYKRAISLDPSYATAHQWYAEYLTAMGRHDEAIAEIKQALKYDLHNPAISKDVGLHYYFAGFYDQAIEQARNTLDMKPGYAPAHTLIGQAYVKQGKFENAIAELQKAVDFKPSGNNQALLAYTYAAAGSSSDARQILVKLHELLKTESVSSVYIAAIYGELGDKQRAFASLEKAYSERSGSLPQLNVNPIMGSLRSDIRFSNLVRRIGGPH